MSRSAERILGTFRGSKRNSLDGINLAKVITGEPNVTILVKGDTIALPLDYFVVPDGLKFKKDEILLAYPLSDMDATNKRFALKPLHAGVMLGVYKGSTFDIYDTEIKLDAQEVFCPFPITVGTNVCIFANRFPKEIEDTFYSESYPNLFPKRNTEEKKLHKVWVVVNIW